MHFPEDEKITQPSSQLGAEDFINDKDDKMLFPTFEWHQHFCNNDHEANANTKIENAKNLFITTRTKSIFSTFNIVCELELTQILTVLARSKRTLNLLEFT